MIAKTPEAPYYAVIFTTLRTSIDKGYLETAKQMEDLAKLEEGYLGIESAREEIGITVSYWQSLEAIVKWKNNMDHAEARNLGREQWYEKFKVRICKVERDYCFGKL
jgi:heme-degrading monooxygenase HmoA